MVLRLCAQMEDRVRFCCGPMCHSSVTVRGSTEIASNLAWCVQVGSYLFTKSKLYIQPKLIRVLMYMCVCRWSGRHRGLLPGGQRRSPGVWGWVGSVLPLGHRELGGEMWQSRLPWCLYKGNIYMDLYLLVSQPFHWFMYFCNVNIKWFSHPCLLSARLLITSNGSGGSRVGRPSPSLTPDQFDTHITSVCLKDDAF